MPVLLDITAIKANVKNNITDETTIATLKLYFQKSKGTNSEKKTINII